MIELLETRSPKVVAIKCSGKVHDEEYKEVAARLEEIIRERGRIRLLTQFEDFHGWDLQAAWDDLVFGLKHAGDLERIAVVGDQPWERWIANVSRWFVSGPVRYFDVKEADKAWYWIEDESVLGLH
ncbi:MAG: hypothetical protein KatS3mg121_0146 [Gammaproteobacteria bacterium]|nr:MAG: hypothetical protein KatS3mg121_0146 [Gammaproteobacteria bacterium]